jgi:hypothetical protein
MSETKFLSKTGLEVLVENLKSYIQTHSSDNAIIVKGDTAYNLCQNLIKSVQKLAGTHNYYYDDQGNIS